MQKNHRDRIVPIMSSMPYGALVSSRIRPLRTEELSEEYLIEWLENLKDVLREVATRHQATDEEMNQLRNNHESLLRTLYHHPGKDKKSHPISECFNRGCNAKGAKS